MLVAVFNSGEMSGMESAVTFMEKVFGGMFGMTISDEVIIEGHNADPSKTEEIIAAGLEKVAEAAKNSNGVKNLRNDKRTNNAN